MEWLGIGLTAAAFVGLVAAALRRRVVVYQWEHALLYVDGRFSKALAPGRHWLWPLGRKLLVQRVPNHLQFAVTGPVDAVTSEGFVLRLSATLGYRVVDPRAVVESQQQHLTELVLAAGEALTAIAAERTLPELLEARPRLGELVLERLAGKVPAVALESAASTGVTLPPETRRLLTEVERAKLESQASLERARGEHAALRSLANAARMLKDNPDLMRLRLLQAVSPTGKGATLVLGQDAIGPFAPPA